MDLARDILYIIHDLKLGYPILESISVAEASKYSYEWRKRKADAKILKYRWVPQTLVNCLKVRTPDYSTVDFDSLFSEGYYELARQVYRLYNIEMGSNKLGDNEELFARYFDEDKGDLTIGPFFMKNMRRGDLTPFPRKDDSGSMKFIKGRILDELRRQDPLTRDERKLMKQIRDYINQYASLTSMTPSMDQITTRFGISPEKVSEMSDKELAARVGDSIDTVNMGDLDIDDLYSEIFSSDIDDPLSALLAAEDDEDEEPYPDDQDSSDDSYGDDEESDEDPEDELARLIADQASEMKDEDSYYNQDDEDEDGE